MRIPYTALSSSALRGIIEDYVLREGTEYGHEDTSLDKKIEQVLKQLEDGRAVITYDEKSDTCSIVRA